MITVKNLEVENPNFTNPPTEITLFKDFNEKSLTIGCFRGYISNVMHVVQHNQIIKTCTGDRCEYLCFFVGYLEESYEFKYHKRSIRKN